MQSLLYPFDPTKDSEETDISREFWDQKYKNVA